ncbi:hypothetical protein S83_039877, partial [Arachis hypogaea]
QQSILTLSLPRSSTSSPSVFTHSSTHQQSLFVLLSIWTKKKKNPVPPAKNSFNGTVGSVAAAAHDIAFVVYLHFFANIIQEGVEALAEDVPVKSVPSRHSSKRSRAAEVHNLSEKRRSGINEKMKALQHLIPNSIKVTPEADVIQRKFDLEQKRLDEDAFVYNSLQQPLKFSPAYQK